MFFQEVKTFRSINLCEISNLVGNIKKVFQGFNFFDPRLTVVRNHVCPFSTPSSTIDDGLRIENITFPNISTHCSAFPEQLARKYHLRLQSVLSFHGQVLLPVDPDFSLPLRMFSGQYIFQKCFEHTLFSFSAHIFSFSKVSTYFRTRHLMKNGIIVKNADLFRILFQIRRRIAFY